MVTDPYGRILGFLDRSRYFFFQLAPQLYSRGCVDPVPDRLLFFFLVVLGIVPGHQDPWSGTLTTRPQKRSFTSRLLQNDLRHRFQLQSKIVLRAFN
jgi:hypothetical protein